MVKLTKIQASTLVETIVAMVVITISFGVAFSILTSISSNNNPQLKFKAYTEVQNAINSTIRNNRYLNEEWQVEGVQFKKVLLPYMEYDELLIIEVKAIDNSGKILIDRKELIRLLNEKD